ncbi:transposase [Caloramator sp. E03]|nr:transposase [Caloramator sp. E03]
MVMPRLPRILINGCIYHVYQRGNNKEFIFKNDKHKAFLIKQLKEYNKRFDYKVLGYVIMDNHYHLIIRTNNDYIDKIMFNINSVVAKFINRELQRTGHVYESRYGCEVVDNDPYLIWLLRYVHRNPVRAGICEKVTDYRWSSNIFYQRNINSFVDINFILNILSSNRFEAIKKYLNLMDISGCDNDKIKDFDFIKSAFRLDDVNKNTNSNKVDDFQRLTLNDIFNSINIPEDIRELILKGSRGKSLIPYKIEFIKLALYNKYSLYEIGNFLNTSADALRKFRNYHKINVE